MPLEAFRGKTIFSGGSGGISRILEWLEGFGVKDRGPCGVWKNLGTFGVFGVVWTSAVEAGGGALAPAQHEASAAVLHHHRAASLPLAVLQ
jgi:hypothetical protein